MILQRQQPTPVEAKKTWDLSENVEKEGVWIGNNDKSIENTQEEAWSISSNLSSMILLDGNEEDNSHQSDRLHLNMIHSKEVANWYKSTTEKIASSKRPHQYSGNLHTSKWRALKDAKKNGKTILNFINPTVSTQMQG
jgi:hypothetical protein